MSLSRLTASLVGDYIPDRVHFAHLETTMKLLCALQCLSVPQSELCFMSATSATRMHWENTFGRSGMSYMLRLGFFPGTVAQLISGPHSELYVNNAVLLISNFVDKVIVCNSYVATTSN